MTYAISPITRQYSRPYLQLAEFKAAPTALDYSNLVAGGTQAQQDAELTNAITRASSWIDQYCNQIIGATADTEQQRVRLSGDGSLRVHPKYFPIVALTDFRYGWTPTNLTQASDCSIAWLEEQEFIYPFSNSTTISSQGPLGFSSPSSSRNETYVRYTYVNGFCNTTLTTAGTAGDTQIIVAQPLGAVANGMLTIYDGANTERVTIASTYTHGSSTITLASPLLYSHTTGVSVGNLPAAIKEACILITSAYLKIRGDASLTMAVTNTATGQIGGTTVVGSDIGHAQEILKPFRRVR